MDSGAIIWILRGVLCAISVLSLLVNSLLLRWISKLCQLRFSRLNHFLASTALGNLVTALAIIPMWLFVLFYKQDKSEESLEEISALFYASFDVFHGLLAALNLVLIAAERFYAAHWPLFHRVATDRPHYVASVSVWLISSLLSSIALIIYCFLRPPLLVVIIASVCFAFPVLVIVILTLKVACLKWSYRLITPGQRNDVRVAVLMASVFLSYTIACLPLHCVHLIEYFTQRDDTFSINTIMALRCLYYGTSVICPAVTIVAIPEIREKLAWCWFKCYAVNEGRKKNMHVMDILEIASSRSSTCNLVRANRKPLETIKVPVHYI